MTYMDEETIKRMSKELRDLWILGLTYNKEGDYFSIGLADDNMRKRQLDIRFMSDIIKDKDEEKNK